MRSFECKALSKHTAILGLQEGYRIISARLKREAVSLIKFHADLKQNSPVSIHVHFQVSGVAGTGGCVINCLVAKPDV